MARPEALKVYSIFSWPTADDKDKENKIMEKFDQYCNPRKNVTWERHKFNTHNQQPGESIDQYVTDLKTKAQICEFAELKDGLIRVCGIICDKTCARLLNHQAAPTNLINNSPVPLTVDNFDHCSYPSVLLG